MFSSTISDKNTISNMRIGLFLAFTFAVVAENMFAPPVIEMDQQNMEDILSPFFPKEVIPYLTLSKLTLFQDKHSVKKRENFWKRSEDSIFGGHLPDYIN